ncbi:MAG: hypothetical protein IJ770_00490 [Alphaproteobacteria bacterium]|nr:hypothetical protein [Alphaproteobacteria bacterium]
MKYVYFSAIFAVVLLCGQFADAAEVSDAEKLARILTASYGADVSVKTEEKSCQVTYPQTVIEEEVTEWVESPTDKDTLTPKTEKVTSVIAETKAECTKVEDFKSYPQYNISISSPEKFLAQIYNQFKLSFLKDIDVKTFSEELNIVPELGLVRVHNLHLADASYTEKDKTTGLKKEVGHLKDYALKQQMSENDIGVKYNVEMSLAELSAVLPFFSLQIGSEKQRSDIEYKIPENGDFNYTEMLQNIPLLTDAKSSAIIKDIKIGTDFIGMSVGFDISTQNSTSQGDEKFIKTVGKMSLDNIAIIGDLISNEKKPKSIVLKYSLKEIPTENLLELIDIQQAKKAQTDESDDKIAQIDEQYAKILDKVAQTAKIAAGIEVLFADASVSGECSFERQNGYLHGINTVKVKNLFNIFSEQKQCIDNPKANEFAACGSDFIFESLKDMIDTTKNDSETVYKYTEQGVFKDNTRIGDAVELNFEKMYQEKKKQDEETEKRRQEMMEMQENTVRQWEEKQAQTPHTDN